MRIERLGEAGLIRLIEETITNRGRVDVGIGDDACVLHDGRVLTTDTYAEGVHFNLDYMSWYEVGQRCACGAISDVVAMAARPDAVLVALALPRGTDSRSVRELYRGIDRVCVKMGCEVAGGDIVSFDRLVLTLTVTGRARRPKLRSLARPGNGLYVTGSLGAAEAGRLVLTGKAGSQKPARKRQSHKAGVRNPKSVANPNCEERVQVPEWAKELVERHVAPLPRVIVVKKLAAEMTSLIDVSDGLATDAGHLAEASRLRVIIEVDRIPMLAATRRLCELTGQDPLEFALTAGEDYELLFTSRAPMPVRVKGTPVTRVGRLETGSGVWVERGLTRHPLRTRGYDHLAKPD